MKARTGGIAVWRRISFIAPAVVLLGRTCWAVGLPANVGAALAENAADVDPIEVTWNERNVPPPGSDFAAAYSHIGLTGKIGGYFANKVYRLCWHDGRIYEQIAWPIVDTGGRLTAKITETSFDGETFYFGEPELAAAALGSRARDPTLMKDSVETLVKLDGAYARHVATDYLTNAGYCLPSRAHEFRTPKLRPVVPILLDEKGEIVSANTESLGGKAMVCLRISAENSDWREAEETDLNAYHERLKDSEEQAARMLDRVRQRRVLPQRRDYVFYFDPTLHYAAVRREERYPDGRLLLTCDCSDFQQLPGKGAWLPRRCVVADYCFANPVGSVSETPLMLRIFALQGVSTKGIPPAQFVLDYHKAGTLVSDAKLAELAGMSDQLNRIEVAYIVPARPEDLDRVIDAAKWKTSTGGGWNRPSTIFILLTVGFALILAWILLKRRLAR